MTASPEKSAAPRVPRPEMNSIGTNNANAKKLSESNSAPRSRLAVRGDAARTFGASKRLDVHGAARASLTRATTSWRGTRRTRLRGARSIIVEPIGAYIVDHQFRFGTRCRI